MNPPGHLYRYSQPSRAVDIILKQQQPLLHDAHLPFLERVQDEQELRCENMCSQ